MDFSGLGHIAPRSSSLSLPAEGDVDESQNWCVHMKIKARTFGSCCHREDKIRRHVCQHFLFFGRRIKDPHDDASATQVDCILVSEAKAANDKVQINVQKQKIQPQKLKCLKMSSCFRYNSWVDLKRALC